MASTYARTLNEVLWIMSRTPWTPYTRGGRMLKFYSQHDKYQGRLDLHARIIVWTLGKIGAVPQKSSCYHYIYWISNKTLYSKWISDIRIYICPWDWSAARDLVHLYPNILTAAWMRTTWPRLSAVVCLIRWMPASVRNPFRGASIWKKSGNSSLVCGERRVYTPLRGKIAGDILKYRK